MATIIKRTTTTHPHPRRVKATVIILKSSAHAYVRAKGPESAREDPKKDVFITVRTSVIAC